MMTNAFDYSDCMQSDILSVCWYAAITEKLDQSGYKNNTSPYMKVREEK